MFTDLFQISIQNYETVLNSINLETLSAIHVMMMDSSWNLARNGEQVTWLADQTMEGIIGDSLDHWFESCRFFFHERWLKVAGFFVIFAPPSRDGYRWPTRQIYPSLRYRE